ncbi:MAG: hypothetical protein SFY92_06385 [Verrucomicrobiae bacterium]|nr:hypothetical protein [Verrucomicrobiae bacterium]
MPVRKKATSSTSSATIGFEADIGKEHADTFEERPAKLLASEGKNGGQFYSPSCVVRCLVERLAR